MDQQRIEHKKRPDREQSEKEQGTDNNGQPAKIWREQTEEEEITDYERLKRDHEERKQNWQININDTERAMEKQRNDIQQSENEFTTGKPQTNSSNKECTVKTQRKEKFRPK